jgi:serine/threonine protein kinase
MNEPAHEDTKINSDAATSATPVKVVEVDKITGESFPDIPGYNVVCQLGQGGMGRVYLAKHITLQRFDAIKMVLQGAGARQFLRFKEEAKAVAQLKHPFIAQVYDTGELNGLPYFTMEYCQAGTLTQKLKSQPMDPRQAATLVMQLAQAVQFCHEQNILHRDLKPSNVLLDDQGQPKLADFGLVKHLENDSRITTTGQVMGSPSYMAPEQASGAVNALGPAVDIYGTGAILYECLTGRPPFHTSEALQTMLLVLTQEPVPIKELVPQVPSDLNTICMKCLEKQPGKRYSSAGALAEDLRRFLAGEPITARPVGNAERLIKWARRRPAWAALAAVGILSLVGFAVGYWHLRQAYSDLSITQKESDKHLQAARTVLDSVVKQYTDDLALIPQSEQIRLNGLNEARNLYQELISIRPKDEKSRVQYAESCTKLAEIERTLNNFDKAAQAYQQASEVLDELFKETKKTEYAWKLLSLKVQQCKLEQDRQDVTRYDQHYDTASKLAAKLAPEAKQDANIASALAQYFTTAGQQFRKQQKLAESEKMYRTALEHRQQAIALWDKNLFTPLEFSEGLAMAYNNVATALLLQLKYPEAAEQIKLAISNLPKEKSPRYQNTLAMFQSNQAVIHEQLKQWESAWKAYDEAAATFKQLMSDYPMVPDYRFRWAKVKLNMIRSMMVQDYKRTQVPLAEIEPVLKQLVTDFPQQPQYREQWKLLQLSKELYEEQAKAGRK